MCHHANMSLSTNLVYLFNYENNLKRCGGAGVHTIEKCFFFIQEKFIMIKFW